MSEGTDYVIATLVANLMEEIALFEELRSTLEDERSYLVDLDADSLSHTTRRKESLLLRHQQIELARRELGAQFHQLGAGLDETSALSAVATVAMEAGIPDASALESLRLKLRSLVDAVREMNELNRGFVAHSLLCVQGSLHLIRKTATELESQGQTYKPTGQLEGQVRDGASIALQVNG